jgi:hypothetical protein
MVEVEHNKQELEATWVKQIFSPYFFSLGTG